MLGGDCGFQYDQSDSECFDIDNMFSVVISPKMKMFCQYLVTELSPETPFLSSERSAHCQCHLF